MMKTYLYPNLKWKRFTRYWPLWWESTGNAGFDVFSDVTQNKRLSKQRRHRAYYDVTVMARLANSYY